jgi:hypothetical protein
MSNVALTWAFRLPVKGAAKPVLLALADCLNEDTGRCDPSNRTLALFAGVDERTVRRACRALAADGLITITDRPGRPSQYTLAVTAARTTPDIMPAPYAGQPRTPRPPFDGGTPDIMPDHPGHHAPPTPDTVSGTPGTAPPKPLEPPVQPTLNLNGSPRDLLAAGDLFPMDAAPVPTFGPKKGAPAIAVIDAEFVEWWAIVPKKVDKAAATKLFHRARKQEGISFDVLLTAMTKYARQFAPLGPDDPHYSIGPAKWLRGERWNDEQPASTRPLNHPSRITPSNPTGRVVLPITGGLD